MYMIVEVSQYVAVASFSEAWIEILKNKKLLHYITRRLLLGGVDWNFCIIRKYLCSLVASFSEAWIEILLKIGISWYGKPSPPSRRRGLKFNHTGRINIRPGRLLLGGVDWNELRPDRRAKTNMSRLLLGGVDWNWNRWRIISIEQSRLLLGGVDWNLQRNHLTGIKNMSPPSRRRGLKYINRLT